MEGGSQRIEAGLKKVEDSSGSVSRSLGGMAVAGGAALGLLVDKIGEATINYNIFNQQAMVTFSALEGGNQAAAAQINTIDRLSVSLSRNREQMADAAKYLQIMTGGAQNNDATLTKLADTSAGLNIPVNELAQKFGFLFQQLQAGGNSSAYAARSLETMGALTRDQVNQLTSLATSGATADQMWKQLMSDLDKFDGSAKAQAGTWAGLKASIHDVFEIDFGKAFEPAFKSLNGLLKGLSDLMDSPLFHEVASRLATDFTKALGPIDSLAGKLENLAHSATTSQVDSLVSKFERLVPILGTVSGLFAELAAHTLGNIPILGDFIKPLEGALSGGKGALLGFLLSTKETRDALISLVGAFGELVKALFEGGSGISSLLNDLAPVAATIIETAAAIVHFAATNSVLLAVIETVVKLALAYKALEYVQGLFKSISNTTHSFAQAHAESAVSANDEATAEERLTAQLNNLTGALTLATAAQERLNAMQAAGTGSAMTAAAGPVVTTAEENAAANGMALAAGGGVMRLGSAMDAIAVKATSFSATLKSGFMSILPEVTGLVIAFQMLGSIIDGARSKGAQFAQQNLTQNAPNAEGNSSLGALSARINYDAKQGQYVQGQMKGFEHFGLINPYDLKQYHGLEGERNALSTDQDTTRGAYDKAASNEKSLMSQYGMSQQQIEKITTANKIDLAGSLEDVSAAFDKARQSASAFGGAADPAVQSVIDGVKRLQTGLKGETGNDTFKLSGPSITGAPDYQNTIDSLNKIKSAAGNAIGVPGQASGEAQSFIDQMHAMKDLTVPTLDAIEHEQQLRQAQRAGAEDAHRMAEASYALAQARYAEGRSQYDLNIAMRDEQRLQADIAFGWNNIGNLMHGVINDHTDFISKTRDLAAVNAGLVAQVQALIDVENSDENTARHLQDQYNSLNDELTQTNDLLKIQQDILAHPLAGSGAQDKAMESNKVAQAQVQAQIDQLTLNRGGLAADPNSDPVLGALTKQLNQLKAQGDLLQQQKTITTDYAQSQIAQLQKLSEVSYTTAVNAAKAAGEMANQQAIVTAQLDKQKPALDDINARIRVEKEYWDPLITAVQTQSAQLETNRQKVVQVQDANNALQNAVHGVQNAEFGQWQAENAHQDSILEKQKWIASSIDYMVGRAAAFVQTYLQASTVTAQVAQNVSQIGANMAFWHLNGAGQQINQFGGTAGPGQTYGPALPNTAFNVPGVSGPNYGMASYDVGGPVAGALGAPVPAIVHGGEFVLSLQMLQDLANARSSIAMGKSGGMSLTISDGAVNVDITIIGDAPADLKQEVHDAVSEALISVTRDLVAKGGS